MAGNTKLIGFGKDIKNPDKYILKLARWGEEVDIEIDRGTVEKLEHACREKLPTQPKQYKYLGRNFKATYNPDYGMTDVKLTLEATEDLATILDYFVEEKLKSGDEEKCAYFKGHSEGLRDCVQAHKDYLNAREEPGLPPLTK